MYTNLYTALYNQRANWKTEEEVRLGWLYVLKEALDINFHAERGKKDSSYNNVVIEFKAPGLFDGRDTSPAFKEAIFKRLLPYITKTAIEEARDQSDYIGIAIDGYHVCFAQVENNAILYGPLLPLSEATITLVIAALKDNYRRALTAGNLIEDFGHLSTSGQHLMNNLSLVLSENLNSSANNKIKMLFEEWKTLFGQVADLSSKQIDTISQTLKFSTHDLTNGNGISAELFVIHTYNSLIIKLLSAEIVSTYKFSSYKYFIQNLLIETDENLIARINNEIEKASFYHSAGIHGFVEEALFSWYIDASSNPHYGKNIIRSIREILTQLSYYRTDNLTQARSKDLLKLFYQNLVPETLRKSLGEFYTPDWLVSFTLDRIERPDWLVNRALDPTCGSGSFLLEIINRKVQAAKNAHWNSCKTLHSILDSIWGFDLNPLAVQTARVNYLIAIADLLKQNPGEEIEIPVLLADAIYSPAKDPIKQDNIVKYKIGSKIADLEITLPSELAYNRQKLDAIFEFFGQSVERNEQYSTVEVNLQSANILENDQILHWRKPLKNTYDKVLNLHRKKWNGIWFRIIRNFFWSLTAGNFEIIAGNPPWVRWSKLPELYRERVKPTCLNYKIFSSTPHHGGNELDISGMITYTVADKWLSENGTLAFILTQTHFQSPSSEGFRSFKINDSFNLNPISVDDFKELKPFPDAANRTAVTIFKKEKNKQPKFPVKYVIWKSKNNFSRNIPIDLLLENVKSRIEPNEFEANPVTKINSPWAILPQGRFRELKKLLGKCSWVKGWKGVTSDLNGIYLVNIIAENTNNDSVKIKTRPEAGKIKIGPAKEFWIESDVLYPLIKGASDFSHCYFKRNHSLCVLVPNTGITKQAYSIAEKRLNTLPKTSKYFDAFKLFIENRSTYKGRMKNAPYFAIYNIGNYTFAPWKVIWAEQKEFCAAVVSSANITPKINRVLIPDHKIYFANFNTPEPAYFLCGLLNSKIVIEFIQSHYIGIQIGDIFKHMKLPSFDPLDKRHNRLIELVKRCHFEDNSQKRIELLNIISDLSEEIILN